MKFLRSILGMLMVAGCASSQEAPQRLEAPEWPRTYEHSGDRIVVYDPQIDGGWKEYKSIHARSAIVLTTRESSEEYDGVMEYDVQTEVNVDAREVLFKDRKIDSIRFPGMSEKGAKNASEIVQQVLPQDQILIPLDFVLAYLKSSEGDPRSVKVNLDPPPIYMSQEPAILLIFMGEPVFKPIQGLSLQFATNTNWDVFLDKGTGRYFLLNGQGWITTRDLQHGPWDTALTIPSDIGKLPPGQNWDEVRAQLPGLALPAPRVFFSIRPAELIVIDGRPVYESIPGTQLSFITNTPSVVFRDESSAEFYFLTSGRWFRSDRLEGPWKAATLDLPQDFSKIPRDSPKADVLASVPGTQEAADAVLLAQVPHRATITRDEVTTTVTYEGEAQFVAIEGTGVQYAVNTPNNVFLVNGKYYCCYEAVWFESASPNGPWVVCASVPKEIYSIPSTHPSYPVTYVYVYDSTPTTVVVGCTAGYYGMYCASGVLVFGMGLAIASTYRYPYYHYGPAYYGYGCGAYYSYHMGGYYSGARYYGPYGGAGWGAAYNPATGTYARGAAVQGRYGHRYFAEAYNPYTGRYSARSGGSTPYAQWGRGVSVQGNSWAHGGYYRDARGTVVAGETSAGGRAAGVRSSSGESAAVARDRYGNLYAGRDGNVYRNTDGQWQERQNGSWTNVDRQSRSDTTQNLQRDAAARDRGWQNTSRSAQRPSGMGRGGRGR
jgi:hypothetical protein